MLCASSNTPLISSSQSVNAQRPSWHGQPRGTKRSLRQSQGDSEHINLSSPFAQNLPTNQGRSASSINRKTNTGRNNNKLTQGRYSSWDMDSLNTQVSSNARAATFHDLWSSSDARPRSRHESEGSARGLRGELDQTECNSKNPSMNMLGSWCNINPTNSLIQTSPLDDYTGGKDFWLDEWHPLTPREERLPTPDLAPLCTDFEFCPCCQNEEDSINEFWYMKSKAKMDDQVNRALEHIATVKSQPWLLTEQ
ncbi:hypothetical protein BGZ63DRAFT_466762 [Mariannaea sp. PMI_226]|nr:hypothetical protein BGZ63DRAFT_466762 [Mariannaea sp. PMI_226]